MNIVMINDLIDMHGDNFTTCNGCSICKQIESLRKIKSPEERFKYILDKGQDMTKSDIALLLENGVEKRIIQKALDMTREQFHLMMVNFGFSKRWRNEGVESVGKLNLSQEEYKRLKKSGLSEKEIASQFQVSAATLWAHKKQWGTKDKSEKKTTPKTNTQPIQDKSSEYEQLIKELQAKLMDKSNEELEKQALIQSLEEKVKQLEGINSACDDVEKELASVRDDRENYLNQLLDSRDKLYRLDYVVENQKKIIEDTGKALERYERENKALRQLVGLWASE